MLFSCEDGISNLETGKVMKNSDNEHLKRDFVGVYPSNHTHKIMMRKSTLSLFDLKHRSRSYKLGTYWWNIIDIMMKKSTLSLFDLKHRSRSYKLGTYLWNIIDIHPIKTIYLFDSFEIFGLWNFIIRNVGSIVNKTLKQTMK